MTRPQPKHRAPTNPARRRLIRSLPWLGAAALNPRWVSAASETATRQEVTVLTAYPDEVVSRFEAAFEKRQPNYRLRIVWRMPHDAVPYLSLPGESGVDVYWSASPRSFAQLARQGALRRLDIDRSGLPDHIGGAPLADPDGYYLATEMAGYGLAIHPAALQAHGLPTPADWSDLAAPVYAGQIVLPSPAKVGFAPALVEIVLQAYGWEAGWALWSRIAGNAVLLEHGSTFITDEVGSGRRAIGLTIDFFAAAAIANGAALRFVYPPHNGINPAHVAITAHAPNPDGARAFVAFVLSDEGQRILAAPDIRKLPVRPAVYDSLPKPQFNPFALARDGGLAYDGERARPRLGLSTAVFEQFLAVAHEDHVALWQRTHQARARGLEVDAIERLLCAVPLSEAEAADPALRALFAERLEGRAPDAPRATERAWAQQVAAHRALAAQQLSALGA